MRKLKLICFLLLSGLTISESIAQNNYTNFENELELDLFVLSESSADCNGSVKIVPLTGESPYRYSIDGGLTFMETDEFNGLCAMKYFVHVRDVKGKLGLVLVNLSETFADASNDNEVDNDNEIEEINNEMSNYSENSIAYRKMQWKLFKLNVPQIANVSVVSEINNESIYTVPVIFPDESQSSNFQMNVERVEDMFQNVSIDMNYEIWEMKVKIQDPEVNNPLEEVLSFFGFNSFEIKNN